MARKMTSPHSPDCCDGKHPDYHAELARLNRIAGQVEGIKRMVEERRYCPDILTQIRAVRAALQAVEANILETHIDACVIDALKAGSKKSQAKKIAELKDIYRRFQA
jgi:DNA-binding FrmR family transcriptional regulator